MPPKSDDFRMPGTPASKRPTFKKPSLLSKAKTQKTVVSLETASGSSSHVGGKYSGPNRKRDVGGQLVASYGDRDGAQAQLQALARVHHRPIAPSTAEKYGRAKAAWIAVMTFLKGTKELAEATLAPGAPVPPLEEIKFLILEMATKGKSGLKLGRIGWSYHTTRDFVHSIIAVRRRHETEPMPKTSSNDLFNYVSVLAKEDKVLTTERKAKYLIEQQDLVLLLAALINPSVAIDTNYRRIQICAFTTFVYQHGLRPGCIVEHKNYSGTGQVLKWKDTDWVITGWEEGVGMKIQSFWRLHWLKNQRMDASRILEITMRNINGRRDMIMDSMLLLEAMAIHNDVFEEDLIKLRSSKEMVLALKLPHNLTMKNAVKDRPIFTQPIASNERSKVAHMTPTERASHARSNRPIFSDSAKVQLDTAPMTYSSLAHYTRYVGRLLGWRNFSLYVFRRTFATTMLTKMPEPHLKHILGHGLNTQLASTEYQLQLRDVDTSGLLFDGEEDHTITRRHNSVAWLSKSDEALNPLLTTENFLDDPEMAYRISVLREAETKVFVKYKCISINATKNLDDQLMLDASNAWADVAQLYANLSTATNHVSRPSSAMSMTSDGPGPSTPHRPFQPRARSASVVSDVSMAASREATPAEIELDPEAYETVMDAILNTFTSMDTHHPFLPLIDSEPNNPRYILLCRYLALIYADHLKTFGVCPWCFADPSLAKKKQEECHTDNFSAHIWVCEVTHSPGFWRCPVCADLIRCGDDPKATTKMSEGELEDIQSNLADHRTQCLDNAFIQFGLKPAKEKEPEEIIPEEEKGEEEEEEVPSEVEDEDGSDVDDAKGKGKQRMHDQGGSGTNSKPLYGRGALKFAIATRIGGARRPLRRYFCPLCLYALEGTNKGHSQKLGDDDRRFSVFFSPKHLVRHFGAVHWNSQSRSIVGGIAYDKKHDCPLPECSDLGLMKTGAMITHMHLCHDYLLLECSLDHEHADECYELPEVDFLTTTDARLMHKHLGRPIPTTTLKDVRVRKVRETQEKKIIKLATKSTNVEALESSVEQQPPVEVSEQPPLPMLTDDATTSPPAISDIRSCLVAFSLVHSDIPSEEIEHFIKWMEDEEVPLSQCLKLSKVHMVDARLNWKMGTIYKVREHVESWLQS